MYVVNNCKTTSVHKFNWGTFGHFITIFTDKSYHIVTICQLKDYYIRYKISQRKTYGERSPYMLNKSTSTKIKIHQSLKNVKFAIWCLFWGIYTLVFLSLNTKIVIFLFFIFGIPGKLACFWFSVYTALISTSGISRP